MRPAVPLLQAKPSLSASSWAVLMSQSDVNTAQLRAFKRGVAYNGGTAVDRQNCSDVRIHPGL
jgi:hypothetical protein